MKNFKLTIEYDGTHYHGWQRQKVLPTIQGEIEKVLSVMTREKVGISGSGRTDAGVHALEQVASFTCDTKITPEAFHSGLNSMLPDDIVIRACEAAPPEFHARYSARGKTYRYRILNRDLPVAIGRQYAWRIQRPLDTAAMAEAAEHLIGTHDFKSFESTGSPREHTIRKLMKAAFRREGEHLLFEVAGSGFLKQMVRNIMGTLVAVGGGRISPDGFREILEARDRQEAGTTAPACGLFLVSVNYDSTEPLSPIEYGMSEKE